MKQLLLLLCFSRRDFKYFSINSWESFAYRESKIVSYKEYLSLVRFSQVGRELMLDNSKHYYIYINFMSILPPSMISLSLLR